MFYLASKFHNNRVNNYGGGGFWSPPPPPLQAQQLQKSPDRIGLSLHEFETHTDNISINFYVDYFLFLGSLRTFIFSLVL